MASVFTRSILVAAIAYFLQYVILPRPAKRRISAGDSSSTVGHSSKITSQVLNYGDLNGKIALITGGSSGIGHALATELFSHGCTVVITSRSLDRAKRAAASISSSVKSGKQNEVIGMALDLTDFDNIQQFASIFLEEFSQLHYLVENAGRIANLDGSLMEPSRTKEGVEHLYAANYLGHFLLTQLLLPTILKTKSSNHIPRIVALTSIVHWFHDTKNLPSLLPLNGYWSKLISSKEQSHFLTMLKQYGNTKFLQICMCFELQQRMAGQLVVTPVIPGFVKSDIGQSQRGGKDMDKIPIKLPTEKGIETTLFALLDDSNAVGNENYVVQPYYSPLHQDDTMFGNLDVFILWEAILQKFTWGLRKWKPHPNAFNQTFTQQLWEESLEAVQSYMKSDGLH